MSFTLVDQGGVEVVDDRHVDAGPQLVDAHGLLVEAVAVGIAVRALMVRDVLDPDHRTEAQVVSD